MTSNKRPAARPVLDDDDPVMVFARPATRQTPPQPEPEPDTAPAPAPARPVAVPRGGREQLDPWTLVPFNCKVPRWLRREARLFAADREQDLQDIQAAALEAYLAAQGWPVDAARPATPRPPRRTQA